MMVTQQWCYLLLYLNLSRYSFHIFSYKRYFELIGIICSLLYVRLKEAC